jgi:hypothetical protein
MEAITIIPVSGDNENQFYAVSGNQQSAGKTMGQALDALTHALEDAGAGTLILIQKRAPDQFFTAEQHARMHDLLDRRDTLTEEERAELVELVDTELDATIARTNALVQQLAA